MQRMRRAAPFALVLFLALAGGAFAGDNAGATFSQSSAATVAGVGAGQTVSIEVNGAGFVGIKNLDVYVRFSDAAAFDLSNVTITTSGGMASWIALAGLVESGTTDLVRVGAATFGSAFTGAATFTISAVTSGTFATGTEATIEIERISLGPSSAVRDVFTSDTLDLGVQLNPPVSDPVLAASTATDFSADFSAVGAGSASNGSAGEVSLGVSFTDATGAAASGQSISWQVTNNGAETVYVLGATTTTVAAGSQVTVAGQTTNGLAAIVLDSEGDKFAGSTSASVTASTSAANSEGTTLSLSVTYAVTWDVPVPAELASFAAEVGTGNTVRLEWTVTSQTNNLGWEVYRSTDNVVFERISQLIPGEGTINTLRAYEFVDQSPPAADRAYYYLRQLDLGGAASRSSVVEVALAPTAVTSQTLPLATELMQNFPNPFNPETTIRFDLATEAAVSLRVYDAAGQIVRTLEQGGLPAGSHVVLWNGLDDVGTRVGSGVYFYELRAGTFTSMKKMTLLR
jgi:hypothetical protein